MTTPNYTGSPTSTGAHGDTGAKEQAKQAAGTAADEGKHVAGVAKDEAAQVADEAKQQARNVMEQAKSQLDDQSRTQRDRLVDMLRTFSDDLERMASGQGGGSGMATDLARQVADRARTLTNNIDGREPAELLEEVRGFARRKPGTFLLGAMVAGMVAGRVTRGAKDASSGGTTSRSIYDDPRGTSTGTPLAGTGYPETDPVYPAGTPATPVAGGPVGSPDVTGDAALGTGTTTGTPQADQPYSGNQPTRGM